jgi:LmbE family N-acetylglucosaminyl deacetylase
MSSPGLPIRIGRRILRVRARPMTSETRTRSALILAPHPDDETLACGGTIALKRSAGSSVTVCVATSGASSESRDSSLDRPALAAARRDEAVRACESLGVPRSEVRLWDFHDGQLTTERPALTAAVSALVDETRPEEVFVPFYTDSHPDHRSLFFAWNAISKRWPNIRAYGYPVGYWTRDAWVSPNGSRVRRALQASIRPVVSASFVSPRTVSITDHIESKRLALEAYRDELAAMDPAFLANFLVADELFFELSNERSPWANRLTGAP